MFYCFPVTSLSYNILLLLYFQCLFLLYLSSLYSPMKLTQSSIWYCILINYNIINNWYCNKLKFTCQKSQISFYKQYMVWKLLYKLLSIIIYYYQILLILISIKRFNAAHTSTEFVFCVTLTAWKISSVINNEKNPQESKKIINC